MQWKREGRKGTDKDFEGMWKDVKHQRERETDKLKRTKFKESRKGQKVINLFEGGGEKKKRETWEKREEKKQEKREEKKGTKGKKNKKKSRWEDNENQGKKERKFKNGGKGRKK